MRYRLMQACGALLITSFCVFNVWLFLFTPFPVYVLDRFNLRPFFLPNITCNNCNNFTYEILVENENFCAKEEIFLLFLVASYHPHVLARKAIRQTWGGKKQYKGLTVKTLFMFGTHADTNLNNQIKYELEHYGDVIQGNYEDKYRTLTNKTMFGLNWIQKYCPQVKYIVKTDDDAFNVPERFVDYLINTHLHTFVGGYCFTIMPDRSPSSKFYTPYEQYPNQHYPTYCSGPGYVMSYSALIKIVEVSSNVKYLPMEDVYVAGMCRVAADIQYLQIEGIVISKHDMTKCNVATWAKNSHNTLPEEALQIWKDNVEPANAQTHCSYFTQKRLFVGVLLLVLWCKLLHHIFRKR